MAGPWLRVCAALSCLGSRGGAHSHFNSSAILTSIHHIPNEALLSELGWLSGNPSSIVICRLCTCRSFPIEGGVESGDNLLKQQEAKIQSSSFEQLSKIIDVKIEELKLHCHSLYER